MNNLYLTQALKNIKNPNILVNMVSQRVRQLGQGHKALVAANSRMSYMDIALKEIADGKLDYEMETPAETEEAERSKKPRKRETVSSKQ